MEIKPMLNPFLSYRVIGQGFYAIPPLYLKIAQFPVSFSCSQSNSVLFFSGICQLHTLLPNLSLTYDVIYQSMRLWIFASHTMYIFQIDCLLLFIALILCGSNGSTT